MKRILTALLAAGLPLLALGAIVPTADIQRQIQSGIWVDSQGNTLFPNGGFLQSNGGVVTAGAGPTITPLSFGAKGDFVNDDSVAINAAVAYLQTVGGGTLYFPTPKVAYGVASAINIASNIRYTGDGPSSIIKALSASTDSVISGGPHLGPSFSNVEIDHICIDGNKTGCSYNTRGGGGNADDSWQMGIRLINVTNARVHDCTIQNTVMDGLSIFSGINVWIRDNLITGIGKGFPVTGSASWYGIIYEGNCQISSCYENQITGCIEGGVFYDLGGTFAFNDISCSKNKVSSCGDQGIFFQIGAGATATTCKRVLIDANQISACGITDNDPGLEVADLTSTTTVSGLSVVNNHVFACYGGIDIGASSTGVISYPLVEDNISVASTTIAGLITNSTCANSVVLGNVSQGNGDQDALGGTLAVWNLNYQDNIGTPPTPTGQLTGASLSLSGNATQHLYNNFATAGQAPSAATRTVITGSHLHFAAGTLKVGTIIHWQFDMTKTAAGSAASTIDIAFGTSGSTSDTAQVSFTKPAGTAAGDEGTVIVEAVVQTNSSSGVVLGNFTMTHNLASTGHMIIPVCSVETTSGTFNTTTATDLELCITTGASDSITINQCSAYALNL